MNKLNELIDRVAGKFLRQGEVGDTEQYHQHEFNGKKDFKAMFGSEKKKFSACFMFLGEYVEEVAPGELTWYDSREKKPDRLPEYRLRYKGNFIQKHAKAGDTLIIALLKDAAARQVGAEVLVIVCAQDSGDRDALCWLFGLNPDTMELGFDVRNEEDIGEVKVGPAARDILSQIGIEAGGTNDDLLQGMLDRFNGVLPSTKDFSAFVREKILLPASASPDTVLAEWVSQEELLFEMFQRRQIEQELDKGFLGEDRASKFLAFAKRINNQRKSRAGLALEHQFEALLKRRGNIRYARGVVTEGKSKPDFLFPGKHEYDDPFFPESRLTMLGAKTTAKDRWRQILAEANRVRNKHLLTMQTGISTDQITQMIVEHSVTPVMPEEIRQTYSNENQGRIMTVSEFLELVEARQKNTF